MDLELIVRHPVFVREQAAVRAGRMSHAYLIEGAAGIGKRSFAYAMACLAFCTGENAPCLTCSACRKVTDGNHPDVHYVEPDGAQFKVDQIRELIAGVYESAYEGGGKIYILDRFHLANEAAQNAFLKTLEEPPAGVTFLLLTENAYALLPTVRSRCKHLHLGPMPQEALLACLERALPGNESNAKAAQQAQGNIGQALRLVQDEAYARLYTLAEDILALAEQPTKAAQISLLLEGEKDSLPALLDILEEKLFLRLRKTPSAEGLGRLRAVQDAKQAKKQNVNPGLLTDELAYRMVKGENSWQK